MYYIMHQILLPPPKKNKTKQKQNNMAFKIGTKETSTAKVIPTLQGI